MSLVEYIQPKEFENLVDEFEAVAPAMFRKPGFVKQFLSRPDVKTAVFVFDGKKSYLVAFHLTDDGGFWVDICKAISGGKTDLLFSMVEKLAKEFKAGYVRFTTSSLGLIELGKKFGYTPEAVLMTKGL